MPPREAKGRYLTREYMADAEFHRTHPATERELYMMLSLFADDAGWLEWDPDYLTYAIYRYDDARDGLFDVGTRRLQESGRLRVYKCGHAFMPKVANRPRSGGYESRVKVDHESTCKSTRSRPKSTDGQPKSSSLPNLTLPNLTPTSPTPNGSSSQPRARTRGGAPRSLKDIVGWDPERGGLKQNE